jgi:hypothetical protein
VAGEIRRVVIALDSRQGCEVALEMASVLAARSSAELVALFVEDLNLVHVAALPFVQEVDPVSAAVREFDELRLVQSLRTQAEQVRRELVRVSERMRLAWSMEVIRGRYFEAAVAAVEIDVLLLARPPGRRRSSAFSRAGPTAQRASADLACVLHDGSAAGQRALALASAIAAAKDLRLAVLVPQDAGVDTAADVAARISQEADPQRISVYALSAQSAPPPGFPASRCKVLLLPRSRAPAPDAAEGWLSVLGCPTVLVP